MTNVNNKFLLMWAYIIVALLGVTSLVFGLVNLFSGNIIAGIASAVCGGFIAYYFGKKAIDKDKE